MKTKLTKQKKWAILLWAITTLAAIATIKTESRLLIVAVFALAIFSYILWTWEESPQKIEQEKKQ